MDKTIGIITGWFISGFLLAYLWQTSTKPSRNRKREEIKPSNEVPFASIKEAKQAEWKQATG
jgi:hypothetical protein